jgi:hypothetical protein
LRSAMAMFRTTTSWRADMQRGARDACADEADRRLDARLRLRQPGYLCSRPVALRPRLTTGVPVRFCGPPGGC